MNRILFQMLSTQITNNQPCGILVMDFAGDNYLGSLPLLDLLISINFVKN